jgi:hypothetical protein
MNESNPKRDAENAHKYRLRQAEEMLRIFQEEHGRPARTTEELTDWLTSPEGRFRFEQKRKPTGGDSDN